MNDIAKNIIRWVVIAVILMAVFQNFGPQKQVSEPLSYSKFLNEVKQGNIKSVVIEGQTIQGITRNNDRATTYSPEDPRLIDDLIGSGVTVEARPPETQGLLTLRPGESRLRRAADGHARVERLSPHRFAA